LLLPCFLSEKTIEGHLARIYDKLGVRSRLVAIVVRETDPRDIRTPV
jgi:DNA-binding NarL/FixJ family response regulator